MVSISTPCIKLCILDEASGQCQGCGRTLDEIARWASFSETERLALMCELPGRMAASQAARRAAAGRINPRHARNALRDN